MNESEPESTQPATFPPPETPSAPTVEQNVTLNAASSSIPSRTCTPPPPSPPSTFLQDSPLTNEPTDTLQENESSNEQDASNSPAAASPAGKEHSQEETQISIPTEDTSYDANPIENVDATGINTDESRTWTEESESNLNAQQSPTPTTTTPPPPPPPASSYNEKEWGECLTVANIRLNRLSFIGQDMIFANIPQSLLFIFELNDGFYVREENAQSHPYTSVLFKELKVPAATANVSFFLLFLFPFSFSFSFLFSCFFSFFLLPSRFSQSPCLSLLLFSTPCLPLLLFSVSLPLPFSFPLLPAFPLSPFLV